MKLDVETLEVAAEMINQLSKGFVGNTQKDGTRSHVVYEQGIGMEIASKFLRDLAKSMK